MLTSFYGHSNTAKRCETRHLLKKLTPKVNTPWLCFGGFNKITSHKEKIGVAFKLHRQIVDFRKVLGHCDLNDLGYTRDRFTWANNRGGKSFTKERIDRAFGNTAWIALFEDHLDHHLSTVTSNHMPILIQV